MIIIVRVIEMVILIIRSIIIMIVVLVIVVVITIDIDGNNYAHSNDYSSRHHKRITYRRKK